MEKKYIINIDKLQTNLNNLQKQPNRTDGELTMFCKNCTKIQNSGNVTIDINEDNGKIKINGRSDISEIFTYLPTRYKINNKIRLYDQIKLAMKAAKLYGIYEEIFQEIK